MTCRPATPCAACDPAPEPILPRCQDVVLADGVFANATVTVENGCITVVTQGAAPQYTPDPCCSGVGGGAGGAGAQGPQGDPGTAATVTVGTVNTLPAGSLATVTNVGTPSAAVLNFELPTGPAGATGAGASGLTGTYAGLELSNGSVQLLPVNWPPVLNVVTSGAPSGVVITATKDAAGTLTLDVDISGYDADIRADFQTLHDAQAALITTLQTQVADLQADVAALCAGSPCP